MQLASAARPLRAQAHTCMPLLESSALSVWHLCPWRASTTGHGRLPATTQGQRVHQNVRHSCLLRPTHVPKRAIVQQARKKVRARGDARRCQGSTSTCSMRRPPMAAACECWPVVCGRSQPKRLAQAEAVHARCPTNTAQPTPALLAPQAMSLSLSLSLSLSFLFATGGTDARKTALYRCCLVQLPLRKSRGSSRCLCHARAPV